MRSTVTRILLALGLLAGIASFSGALAQDASYGAGQDGANHASHSDHASSAGAITPQQIELQQAMRALWDDHVTWTRLFIVEFAADSPATDATAQRLLQNQVAIGDAIKPFYGDDAGTALTALLTDHILGAVDLLTAAKSGDTGAVDEASARWYANGDDIAAFLSAANPEAWPLDVMRATMKGHLDHTVAEAVAHLNGDWPADIAAYDAARSHILDMADVLSAGIISQFPESFS